MGSDEGQNGVRPYAAARLCDVRRLASARVLAEIDGVRGMPFGTLYLAAWFETEGWFWLECAGLGHLAELSPAELAERVSANLQTVLGCDRRRRRARSRRIEP